MPAANAAGISANKERYGCKMERKNCWKQYSDKRLNKMEEYTKEYMHFLNHSKTERECADTVVNLVEKEGFTDLAALVRDKKKLKAGDKVYATWMNKAVILCRIGEKPMEEGMNIVASHIDSPRLDIKPNPLYENTGVAYLDTHYYGGIKKYQWVTLPLAIHGVVVKKDGITEEICIGEDKDDPVVFISDLLPHLSQEQQEKKASELFGGEALDIVFGNRPMVKKGDEKEEKEAVKAQILRLLEEMYDMKEEDFLSAELEVVPAGKAREAGLDRSMIMAYGQDDKVCAYAAIHALLHAKKLARTSVVMLTDKEEIGNYGATGMTSHFYENALAEIMNLTGEYSSLKFRRAMAASNLLSADVSSVFDPMFADSFEQKNVAYLGGGLVFNKVTGARGKSGANDANAEYLGALRGLLDEKEVTYQYAEYGRIDLGGSGTISHILAEYAMNVVDCGTAVMNMHAPYEVTSKVDVYETMRGYRAFLEDFDLCRN